MPLLRDKEARTNCAALMERHIVTVKAAHAGSSDLRRLQANKLVALPPIAARSAMYGDRLRQWCDSEFSDRARGLQIDVLLTELLATLPMLERAELRKSTAVLARPARDCLRYFESSGTTPWSSRGTQGDRRPRCEYDEHRRIVGSIAQSASADPDQRPVCTSQLPVREVTGVSRRDVDAVVGGQCHQRLLSRAANVQ
jgi:hypothetical protein